MYNKNTKVVCTLGPSSNSVTEIHKLVQAGMNVARLNFSHGDYKEHQEIINNIRKVEKISGKRIGILQDLQGPKIRLGMLQEGGIQIKKSDLFILTSNKVLPGAKEKNIALIPIQFKNFSKGLKKNDSILFNDGLIEAKVLKVINKTEVKCIIKCGGLLRSRAGVHLPSISNNVVTITDKDKQDLEFGLKNKVDFVALSFVKSAKDINDLRNLIQKNSHHPQIIAKIELKLAVDNLEKIIQVSDGIMVARGDLGIDIPAEYVPIIQKRIIALCNTYAKPVITATEVLLSMVTSPRATRAEVSDAANAVFDHTDAIMLSNESAIGKFPTKAAATLTKVASTVEKELQNFDTGLDGIVVYSSDGLSARHIAQKRSYTPVTVIAENEKVARELTLVWGLNNIFVLDLHKLSPEKRTPKILEFLKKQKVGKKNDKLLII
ncbi:MAG: pyruvate kinase [Patescibacteria group bacterium]